MRYRSAFIITLCAAAMLGLAGCGSPRHNGVWFLRWNEKPGSSPETLAAPPEDRVAFTQVTSWDADEHLAGGFASVRAQLQEGDVIAYRMHRLEADRKIVTGHMNAVGYRLYKYGHLSVLLEDPDREPGLRQFSSQNMRGVNTDDPVDELEHHRFDVYRLTQWPRVNVGRMHEFVRLAKAKAGRRDGYDFSGMFAVYNSNLDPQKPEEIGDEYICSTTVLAAFQYAGVQLDAARNAGLVRVPENHRHGVGDLVTPNQVVMSEGFLRQPPDVTIVAVQQER